MLRYASLSLGGIDVPQLVGTRLDQYHVGTALEDRTAAVLALKTYERIEQFRRKEHRTRRLAVARKTHRVFAVTLLKRANHGLKRIRAHKRLVARQKEATFPVALCPPRKARTDALAAQLGIVQHARAMLVLANLSDLGPTRRNHDVKALGNRIDGPGNQRLAIDIGKHLVRAKPFTLARSHNDATKFHGDTSPETIVPITRAAGHLHRKRLSRTPTMQKGGTPPVGRVPPLHGLPQPSFKPGTNGRCCARRGP